MRKTHVLVVDDFKEWRLKLSSMLGGISNVRVVGEASNGLEAIEIAAKLRPDIILLDIAMPGMDGIEAAPAVRQASPESKIIFLTLHADDDIRKAALDAGADAYVWKLRAAVDLKPAIASVLLDQTSPHATFSPSFISPSFVCD